MNNAGFSKIIGLILLALSAGASYFIVTEVWKPEVDANMRMVYIAGGAVAGFIILNVIISLFGGRKSKGHLEKARQALAEGDPVTASETVYPYLRRCLGDDGGFTDDILDLLEQAYEEADVEIEMATLRDLHRQMCEIAAQHKGANGLIKDPEANAAYNQLNAQAEGVIQSFPRLG